MLKKFLIGTFVVAAFAFALVVSAAYDFGTTTLKVGSKGPAVVAVQTVVGATADGSFGPLTEAKVKAWQANNGLVADGLFGNKSKAVAMGAYNSGNPNAAGSLCPNGMTLASNCTLAANAQAVALCPNGMTLASNCATAPAAGTVTTGPLVGTAGEIADINQLSQYSAEEVGAGSKNIKVMGFDVEATNEGDIAINTIKLTFDSNGNAAADSDRISDYLANVYIYQGSTKIGSASAADFYKDSTGVYSKTFALSNSVVRASQTEKFYVSVDAINNLDSGDIDSDSWTVAINNLRYTDGSGVTTTVDSADALLTGNMDYDAAGEGVAISFVTFSSAADTELKISASTSNPVSTTVKVSTTADTDDVVLLKGKLQLLGTSNVWLDQLPITITSTGDSISALTGNVNLTINGKTFTESTGANCVDNAALWVGAKSCDSNTTSGILFDNLDLTITAGDTIDFTVSADMNDLENTGVTATDFDAGDTLLASLTTTGRASIVAENAEGEQLTDATEMTGSATGNAQTFRSTGVNVVMGTPTIVPTVHSTTGAVLSVVYSIPVTATSFGDTLYTGLTAQLAAAATASNAFALVFQNSSAPTTSDTNADIVATYTVSTSDASIVGSGYELTDGIAKHFTIAVNLATASTPANSYRVALKQLKTFTASTLDETPAVGSSVLNALAPVENYQTNFQYID